MKNKFVMNAAYTYQFEWLKTSHVVATINMNKLKAFVTKFVIVIEVESVNDLPVYDYANSNEKDYIKAECRHVYFPKNVLRKNIFKVKNCNPRSR